MQIELRNKAKELLETQAVELVIGYAPVETGSVGAVFYTKPGDCENLVWDSRCTTNLTVYLQRKELKKYGKIAILVKGCDAKALAVLEVEKQIDREKLHVIGMYCEGVLPEPVEKAEPGSKAEKCKSCDVHFPLHCDCVILPQNLTEEQARGRDAEIAKNSEARYEKLEILRAMSSGERLEYWKNEFDRCFKCFACRQVCPLCYCEVCIADKNRPVRFDTSATPKGNFAWHIVRAFHLAGRCIGCAACSTACPAGIDLDLLNLSLAKAAEQQFGFRSGYDRETLPLIGSFSTEDHEEFIR